MKDEELVTIAEGLGMDVDPPNYLMPGWIFTYQQPLSWLRTIEGAFKVQEKLADRSWKMELHALPDGSASCRFARWGVAEEGYLPRSGRDVPSAILRAAMAVLPTVVAIDSAREKRGG